MDVRSNHTSAPPLIPEAPNGRARALFSGAVEHDHAGLLESAIQKYRSAIATAEEEHDLRTLAEALRRLAIALHRRSEWLPARTLCRRSHEVAAGAEEWLLAAQALNTLAAFDLAEGEFESARERFQDALQSGGADFGLRGRIEQNLGILANIRGDLVGANGHYQSSLEAFRHAGDESGCAMAYNSLGMVSADQLEWDRADAYFQRSVELTTRLGDVYLRGLALLNHTEVHIARANYQAAQQNAESALRIFDKLGMARYKSDAYRILGMIYRKRGQAVIAEARLQTAIELAGSAGAVLEQAEGTRELAQLFRELGRNQDALRLLNDAHRLFQKLDARIDMLDVTSRLDSLEGTYLTIVHDWGQSIESTDSYTHGHCERVATYALSVARALELDETTQTTIRLGAYLHDLGKIRVPHEILNKAGKLTAEEFEVMKRHPVDGLELLSEIEFPWDIKPMIRWHHEKCDGSGYPDGLRGDDIPVNAQIICIADIFDALTTTRSYRPAMSWQAALTIIDECRAWWHPDVFEAFIRSIRVTLADAL